LCQQFSASIRQVYYVSLVSGFWPSTYRVPVEALLAQDRDFGVEHAVTLGVEGSNALLRSHWHQGVSGIQNGIVFKTYCQAIRSRYLWTGAQV